MADKGKKVLLLPGNGRNSYLHLGQSLGRLGRHRVWVLGSLSSQRRRRGPRAFLRLPNRSSRPTTLPRWVVCELGSPLRAGGFSLLLLFAGEDVVAFLSLAVGLPLDLVVPALASARLSFLSRPCAPLGVEYISVVAWKTTGQTKVNRLIQRRPMQKTRFQSGA